MYFVTLIFIQFYEFSSIKRHRCKLSDVQQFKIAVASQLVFHLPKISFVQQISFP